MSATTTTKRPPRDGYRATPGVAAVELLRTSSDNGAEDEQPVMAGHFSVFDQWTEIDSMWEGNFLERIAPGAYKKTMREQRDGMRVLLNHGMDPQLGDKPLGPISVLREDNGSNPGPVAGAYYEVPLLDASYVRDLVLPGLEAGLYGASFRFRVIREEWNDEPSVSDYNPKGLPERSILETSVSEFGPVTFPAYEGATAGMRSLTDELLARCFSEDPERLRSMFERAQELGGRRVSVTVNQNFVDGERDADPADVPDSSSADRDEPAAPEARPEAEGDAGDSPTSPEDRDSRPKPATQSTSRSHLLDLAGIRRPSERSPWTNGR